ncbi:MAG: hypothetical protein ACW981_07715 [Candidatus Hodarchaeales archaeon]|jgi:hypothetical protein
MFSQQFKDLIDYFNSIGPQFDLAFAPEVGTYYPASIVHLSKIFQELIDLSLIFPNQTFLDAGSGDGRVVALASLFGFESYGIELNKLIYESSLEHVSKLVTRIILPRSPLIVCGDVLSDTPYNNLKKNFRDFQIIFNFNTLPYELLEKIKTESPMNTIFIFNSISQILEIDNGFNLIRKFNLDSIHQLVHVYRKLK